MATRSAHPAATVVRRSAALRRLRIAACATAFAASLFAAPPAAAEVYYYRDDMGRIQISDSPVHEGFRKITPEGKSQFGVVESSAPAPGSGAPAPGRAAVPAPAPAGDPFPADLYEVDDSKYGRLIREAALENGLDPALVRAVVKVESDFNPRCVSRAGAQGLMQLMPVTAKEVGCDDPFDPAKNLRGGSRYLRKMIDRFGDLDLALAAYNAGPGRVERAGRKIPEIRETVNYVKKVNHYFGRFRAVAPPTVTRTTDLRRQAVAQYRRGRVERAIELFREVTRVEPSDPVAHFNLGYLYSREGYYQKAIRMYRAALALDPYMSVAWYNLAVTLERRGDYDEAVRVWRDYIARESDPEKAATAARYIAQIERYRDGER